MGNKCSCPCTGRSKAKEKQDSSNPALLTIREAQRKYFNSHIESDIDDSDDDLDIDQEDSVDNMYGSVDSLDVLDSVSVDSQLDDSTRSNKHSRQGSVDTHSSQPVAGADTSELSVQTNLSSSDAAPANGGAVDESKRDSGNGSATQIVATVESSSIVTSPRTTEREDSSQKTDDTAGTDSPAKKGSKNGQKPQVRRRNKKRKFIQLSRRGNFFSIFNTEDKKARSVDPSKYEYPFENLVFEGGGNKGLAYCGAVRVSDNVVVFVSVILFSC